MLQQTRQGKRKLLQSRIHEIKSKSKSMGEQLLKETAAEDSIGGQFRKLLQGRILFPSPELVARLKNIDKS